VGEMKQTKRTKKMIIKNYNGAILISAMKFGRLITMRYFFYSDEEAIEEFTIYLKNLKK
jgi:hypothetical protein